jgi:hypothetical protein
MQGQQGDEAPLGSTATVLRLLRMTYLVDWRSLITRQRALTEAQWEVDAELGPVSPEVIGAALSCVRDEPLAQRLAGQAKLSDSELKVVDFVLQACASRPDEWVTQLVNSTFPMLGPRTSGPLNLPMLAKPYLAQRSLLMSG